MGAHRWLRFGDKLASLTIYLAGLLVVYVLRPFPHHLGAWAIVALIGGLIATFLLGIVVHELGHVLAIRLAGRRPAGKSGPGLVMCGTRSPSSGSGKASQPTSGDCAPRRLAPAWIPTTVLRCWPPWRWRGTSWALRRLLVRSSAKRWSSTRTRTWYPKLSAC
jgi:hypothetical protein